MNSPPRPRSSRPAAALALMLLGVMPAMALAQQGAQKSFARAREAVAALVDATKAGDVGALYEILGPSAASLISSGDDTQDKNDRAQFVSLYETHHRLTRTAPDQLTLLVGNNEWPLPVPLVKSEGQWRFDSEAGARELLARRVGANELAALKVLQAQQRAQHDYAASGHDGNDKGIYAQRFRSRPGKQDGLYWPVAAGEAQSPAGPLVADAEAQGYEGGKRQPFHGYYLRMLTSQGENAPGGAQDYVVDGKMTGGFGILAYPVEYGASGVMSFMISSSGTLYEKDLGASTAEIAKAMRSFEPDPTWKVLK